MNQQRISAGAYASLASPDEFSNYTYDHVENIDHTGDCEEMHNQKLSGDELSDFEFTDVEYERFTKPNARIAILARMILAEPDDKLYSGVPITSRSSTVLLLSFVFKHKLTRPNSCKAAV